MFVSYALHLLLLDSCYAVHINIVNKMKVYIERSNMQDEFIRFRNFVRLFTFVKLGTSDPLYVYSLFARWQHASPQSVKAHCSKSKYFASIKSQYACLLYVLMWND